MTVLSEGKMVDLGGYVIILVETNDKRVKLYGKTPSLSFIINGNLGRLGLHIKQTSVHIVFGQHGPYLVNMAHICSTWSIYDQHGPCMIKMAHIWSTWPISGQYGPYLVNMVHVDMESHSRRHIRLIAVVQRNEKDSNQDFHIVLILNRRGGTSENFVKVFFWLFC